MWTLLQDLRHAARAFLKSPGFTLVAVATAALGIGANTAIFSVVDSVLLKPLPFPEAHRLVSVWESRIDKGWPRASFSHANFWNVRDLNRSFESIGAFRGSTLNLTGLEFPQRLTAGFVSAGFFQALGARPIVGRIFLPGEDEPGTDTRLVLLSNRLWVSRFGADRAVVGRALTLDGESYTVVGVLPGGEQWLDAAQVFVPLVRRADADRTSFELAVVGRLRTGVPAERALADL